MPKACVADKMKGGMSRKRALKACYPKTAKVAKAADKAARVLVPGYGAVRSAQEHVQRKKILKKQPSQVKTRKPKKRKTKKIKRVKRTGGY